MPLKQIDVDRLRELTFAACFASAESELVRFDTKVVEELADIMRCSFTPYFEGLGGVLG